MCFLKALGLSLCVPSLEGTCLQTWYLSFSKERKCLGGKAQLCSHLLLKIAYVHL